MVQAGGTDGPEATRMWGSRGWGGRGFTQASLSKGRLRSGKAGEVQGEGPEGGLAHPRETAT